MAGPKISNVDTSKATTVGPHIFFRPISDNVDAMVLVATTAASYTVPNNTKYLLICATEDFYVKSGATAAIPSANITNGSAAELNPSGYSVDGGEVLSFISLVPTVITITAFSRSSP